MFVLVDIHFHQSTRYQKAGYQFYKSCYFLLRIWKLVVPNNSKDQNPLWPLQYLYKSVFQVWSHQILLFEKSFGFWIPSWVKNGGSALKMVVDLRMILKMTFIVKFKITMWCPYMRIYSDISIFFKHSVYIYKIYLSVLHYNTRHLTISKIGKKLFYT